jgi:hypothetical protein
MEDTPRIKKIKELAITYPDNVTLCPFLLDLVRWIGEDQFQDFYYHYRRLNNVEYSKEEYLQEVIEVHDSNTQA